MPKFSDSILKRELDIFYAKMQQIANQHAAALRPPSTLSNYQIEQWKKRKAHTSTIFNFILAIRSEIFDIIGYFDEGKVPGVRDWIGIIRKAISIWQQFRKIVSYDGEEIFSTTNEDGSKDIACYNFCKAAIKAFSNLPDDINQLLPFVSPEALSISFYVPILATFSLKPVENASSKTASVTAVKGQVNKENPISDLHHLTVSKKLFGQEVHLPYGDFIERLKTDDPDIKKACVNLSMYLKIRRTGLCRNYFSFISDYSAKDRRMFDLGKDFFRCPHEELTKSYSQFTRELVLRKNLIYADLVTVNKLLKEAIGILAAMEQKEVLDEFDKYDTSLLEYNIEDDRITETNIPEELHKEASYFIGDVRRIYYELLTHQQELSKKCLDDQYTLYLRSVHSVASFQSLRARMEVSETTIRKSLEMLHSHAADSNCDHQIARVNQAIACFERAEEEVALCLNSLEELKRKTNNAKQFPALQVEEKLLATFHEKVNKHHQDVMREIDDENIKLRQRMHSLAAQKVELKSQLSIVESQKQMSVLPPSGVIESGESKTVRDEIAELTRSLRICEQQVHDNLTTVSQLLTIDPAKRPAVLNEAQQNALRLDSTLKELRRDVESCAKQIPADKSEWFSSLQMMTTAIIQQSNTLKHQLLIASEKDLTNGLKDIADYNTKTKRTSPPELSIPTFWRLLESMQTLEGRVKEAKRRVDRLLAPNDRPKDMAFFEYVKNDLINGDWFTHPVSIPETIQSLQADIVHIRQQLQVSKNPIAPDFYLEALSKIERQLQVQNESVKAIRSTIQRAEISWINKMMDGIHGIIHYHSPMGKIQLKSTSKQCIHNKIVLQNYREICDRLPPVIDRYVQEVKAINESATDDVRNEISQVSTDFEETNWEIYRWKQRIDEKANAVQDDEMHYLKRKQLVAGYKKEFREYLNNRAKSILYLLKDIFVFFSDDTQTKRRQYFTHLSGLLDKYAETGEVRDGTIAIAEIQRARNGYLNPDQLTKDILSPLESKLFQSVQSQSNHSHNGIITVPTSAG
jgi:hypothetical protein